MPEGRLTVLHAIHDFVPRHLAGSEIYAFELGRALGRRHGVTVLAAEYDPARRHGEVTWRVENGVPVVEVVNNLACRTFEETYRPPEVTAAIDHVLHAVQPDVLHVHNLLNLSFDLPAMARARGIPVVATLHDYTLVCPSGGQRIHRAEAHVCRTIEPERCARCVHESATAPLIAFTNAVGRVGRSGLARRAASGLAARLPRLTASAARRFSSPAVTSRDIEARLTRAREVFRTFDLVVAPSRAIRNEFAALGMDAAQIEVSDNGLAAMPRPTVPGAVANALPPSAGRPLRIGFVGTVVWHKGVHVLVEAARLLPPRTSVVKIFGDLSVSPGYAKTLTKSAAGLDVEFMGPFDRTAIADVYASIDVLVVPSLWLENSPLVIHEAFMAGVPVVAARMGGIADLVTDGVNGLLYDATSSAALAAALRTLIDDPSRVSALACHAPAVKSIDDDARDWEARYAAVIARRAERHPA